MSSTTLIEVPPEPSTPRRVPFIGRLQGQGKVTVPKNIRDLLDLKDGDYLELVAVAKITGEGGPSDGSL